MVVISDELFLERLGAYITHKRKRKGLGQKEVGLEVDQCQRDISEYENGDRMMKAVLLFKLAEVLDMSLDDVMKKCMTVGQNS